MQRPYCPVASRPTALPLLSLRSLMSRPPKKPAQPSNALAPQPAKDRFNLTIRAADGESPGEAAEAVARALLQPSVQAALTVSHFQAIATDELTLDALVAELTEQCGQVAGGKMARGEAMLTAQAHTLDAIFGTCARRGKANMNEYPQAADTYMRLAFKAQSQCRATWETIATIKNPPAVAFVKQANYAAGNQQVNNGTLESAHARENENPPTKLLEATDGKRLDTGATGEAIRGNQTVEAVGKINGPKVHRRKSARLRQRV